MVTWGHDASDIERRLAPTTRKPRSTNKAAHVRPMPDEAPVMRTILRAFATSVAPGVDEAGLDPDVGEIGVDRHE